MPSPAPTFDVAARHTMALCTVCGVSFALPTVLYLQRVQDAGTIHCPNGHANALSRGAVKGADWIGAHAETLKLLHQARHEATQYRAEADALRPADPNAPPVGDDEVRRRCRVLVERGESTQYGRRLCRWCGKPKRPEVLRRHYWDAHKEDVRALPARMFD